MALNKHGIFFTMLSVFIVGAFVLIATSQSFITLKDRIPVVERRVQLANDHIQTVENVFLPRLLKASGRNTLYAATMYLNWSRQDFLPDEGTMQSYLHEMVLNGSIDTDHLPLTLPQVNPQQPYLLEGNNFTFWLEQLENFTFAVTRLNLTFNKSYTALNNSLQIYQSNATGPWNVGFNITLNYTLDAGIAKWNRSATVSVLVPITLLDDPVYFINALQDGEPLTEYSHKIRETNITQWNATFLDQFINDSTYRASQLGPGFLMRLYNNLSALECCGIESAVNSTLASLFLYDKDDAALQRSFIDWCFYGNRCPPDPLVPDSLGGDFWNITGVTDYRCSNDVHYAFKIDTTNGARYNITSLLYHTYTGVEQACT